MTFELHYDLISGCSLHFSLGVRSVFSRLGVQLLRCNSLATGLGQSTQESYHTSMGEVISDLWDHQENQFEVCEA